MGRRGHRFFLGGGGVVVRCRGFIEEKSPDFRFPEVGISAFPKKAKKIQNRSSLTLRSA